MSMYNVVYNDKQFVVIKYNSVIRIWLNHIANIKTEFDFSIENIKLNVKSAKPSVFIKNLIKKAITENFKIVPENGLQSLIDYYSDEKEMIDLDNSWHKDSLNKLNEKIEFHKNRIKIIKNKVKLLSVKISGPFNPTTIKCQ